MLGFIDLDTTKTWFKKDILAGSLTLRVNEPVRMSYFIVLTSPELHFGDFEEGS